MKNRILYTLLLLPNLFFAKEDYSNEHFQKALDSYNNRIFQDSYLALKEYLKKDKLNSNLTFMLARSAYEIGKFDEAATLYKALLEENPYNSRVKLELAQTYFQQKKFDEAESLYQDVLKDNKIPSSVRKNIELTLNSLNKKSQKNFLKTTLSFGYGYDSNVDNNSNDDFVHWGTIPFSIPDKKSDQVTEYILALNHTYKIKDDLTIDNKFVAYMQKYNHEKDNDLSLAVFGTGLSYYSQNYKLSLGFDYNYVWLDSSTYLYNYILTPSLEYQLDKNLIYKSKLKLIKKDFKQEEYEFRDSQYYELQNSLVLLTENFGMNTILLSVGTDNKDKGKAWNVDYTFASIKYENLYPLTSSTLLSSAIELYSDRYKEKEQFLYNSKKRDDKLILDLGIIQSLNKNLSIAGTIRYIDNSSNQNIYDYDKYIARTNLYYTF